MALTQYELNQASCHLNHHDSPCRHDILYFAARCHPNKGVTAEYIKSRGVLQFRCRKCMALVCDIAVATSNMEELHADVSNN